MHKRIELESSASSEIAQVESSSFGGESNSINGSSSPGLDDVRFRFKALIFDSQLQYFFLGTITYSVINLIFIATNHHHNTNTTTKTNNNNSNNVREESAYYLHLTDNSIIVLITIVMLISILILAIVTIISTINQQLRIRKLKYLPRKEKIAPWLPANSIGLIISFISILWPTIYLNIMLNNHHHDQGSENTSSSVIGIGIVVEKGGLNERLENDPSDSASSSHLTSPWMLFLLELSFNYWPISPLLICLYMLPIMCKDYKSKNIIIVGSVAIVLCMIRLAVIHGCRLLAHNTRLPSSHHYSHERSSRSKSSSSSSSTIPISMVQYNKQRIYLQAANQSVDLSRSLDDDDKSYRKSITSSSSLFDVMIENDGLIYQCLADIIVSLVSLLCGLIQRRTLIEEIDHKIFEGTKQLIEAKVNLEHQRQQQETLLLSVLPAYVADQVKRNMLRKITTPSSQSNYNETNSDSVFNHVHTYNSNANNNTSTSTSINNTNTNANIYNNTSTSVTNNHHPITINTHHSSIGLGSSRRGFNELYICTYHNVSLLYADIVGFTRLCTQLTSSQLVTVLNDLFSRFDQLAQEHRILRIKILGDCYYGVCGIPETAVLGSKSRASGHNHAINCVNMGLDMIKVIRSVGATINAEELNMRIGVHTGHIHSGVIGLKKWQFDVWSNDVSIAMHCESSGIAGRVHCTSATINLIHGAFDYEDGDGTSRDPFLARLDIHTFLIIRAISDKGKDTGQSFQGKLGKCSNLSSNNEQTVRAQQQNNNNELQQQQLNYSRPFSAIDHTSVENIRVATMSTINQTLISIDRPYCFENHHDLNAITLSFRDELIENSYKKRKVRKLFYYLSVSIIILIIIIPIIESLLLDDNNNTIALSSIIILALSASLILLTFILDREKCNCDSSCDISSKPYYLARDNAHRDGGGGKKQSNLRQHQQQGQAQLTNQNGQPDGSSLTVQKNSHRPSIGTYNDRQQNRLETPKSAQYISIVTINNTATGSNVKTSLMRDTLHTMRTSVTTSKPFQLLHFHVSRCMTLFKVVSIIIILLANCSLNIFKMNRLDLDNNNATATTTTTITAAPSRLIDLNYKNKAQYGVLITSSGDSSKLEMNKDHHHHHHHHHHYHHHRQRRHNQHQDQLISPFEHDQERKSPSLSDDADISLLAKHNTRPSSSSSFKHKKINNQQNRTKYKELTIVLIILTIDALNPLSFPIKWFLISSYILSVILVPVVKFLLTNNTHNEHSIVNVMLMSLCSLSGPSGDLSSSIALSASLCTLILIFSVWSLLFKRQFEYITRTNFLWRQRLNVDQEELEYISGINKVLLENILPSHVVQYYMNLPKSEVLPQQSLSMSTSSNQLYHEQHDHVAVMFASIPYFYEFYDESDINKQGLSCIALLNEIICDFDKLLSKNKFSRIEKIKTIGSTYMAASGLTPITSTSILGHSNRTSFDEANSANADASENNRMLTLQKTNLVCIIHFASGLMNALNNINKQSFQAFKLRIGISNGPVIAGVVGAQRPFFDIWGDSVNIASRMESLGEVDRIQVGEKTAKLLMESLGDNYSIVERGPIEVKGIGSMKTYFIDKRPSLIPESRCQSRLP